MKPDEVQVLLRTAALYQANLRPDSDSTLVTAAQAWYMALDTRLDLATGQRICAELASVGTRLHPSTLNDAFLAEFRAAHLQGAGRPRLPFAKDVRPATRPAAIGAPDPVKPDEVPEYREFRRKQHERKANLRKAWSVPCPYCNAEAGSPCVTGGGARLTHTPVHPSRADALRKVLV